MSRDGNLNMSSEKSNSRRNVYMGIVLLGTVSLLGDVVYEGSRGLVPDYLKFLGATALVTGLVGGAGEFLGHAVRLVSGYLADTTHAYWLFIFAGYGLIISIPLLGVSYSLEFAVLLVLLERLGKALRSPSRDTVLSVISKEVGTGKAFGLHEFLDQIGAVLGPLAVAILMFSTANDYQTTFSVLLVPFLALLLALAYTYKRLKARTIIESKTTAPEKRKLSKPFYVYTFAVLLNTVGLLPAQLVLFKAAEIVRPLNQDWIVPLIYVLIQGVDAPVALASGYAYDKLGVKILAVPFMLSVLPALFSFSNGGLTLLLVAAVFSGVVLGMQESIYRAAVSDLSPASSRGLAYGIFNTAYGTAILLSGVVYGVMIDRGLSLYAVLAYSLVLQAAAVMGLARTRRTPRE